MIKLLNAFLFKTLLITCFLCIANLGNAQTTNTVKLKNLEYPCGTEKPQYKSFCNKLIKKIEVEDEEALYLYKYEEELAKLANADYEKDGDAVYVKKIHDFVAKNVKCLVCYMDDFGYISLLKVGVATIDYDYVQRAVKVYGYPVDVVDEDGKNVLDFIYESIENVKARQRMPHGPITAELLAKAMDKLKNMDKVIKEAGGKYHKYKVLN